MQEINKLNISRIGILALRSLQFISIGCIIAGFIWSTSDYLLLTVLVDSPVTPLSILLMLYGIFGSSIIEVIIRFMDKHFKKKVSTKRNG